jgi:hypothetical protein
MLTIVRLTNISPTSTPLYSDITDAKEIAIPQKAWFGNPYHVEKSLKIVRSDVCIHKEGPELQAASKMDPHAKKMILVGYKDSTTYRLYNPESDSIVTSCSVAINEEPMKTPKEVEKFHPPSPSVEDLKCPNEGPGNQGL